MLPNTKPLPITILASLLQVERGELNLTFPIMFNPVTWEAHAFPVFFGGSKVVDDIIESVPAVQLVWFLRTDTKLQEQRYFYFIFYFEFDLSDH